MKAHVSRLFDKLQVTNRVQIAICVHDAGLVVTARAGQVPLDAQTSYVAPAPGQLGRAVPDRLRLGEHVAACRTTAGRG